MEPKIIRKIGVAFFIFLVMGFVYMYINSSPVKNQQQNVSQNNQTNNNSLTINKAYAKTSVNKNTTSAIKKIEYVSNKLRNKRYTTHTVITDHYQVEITSKGAESSKIKR